MAWRAATLAVTLVLCGLVALVLPVVVVAAVFEVAVPALCPQSLAGYADPYDLAAYAAGAMIALVAWRGRDFQATCN